MISMSASLTTSAAVIVMLEGSHHGAMFKKLHVHPTISSMCTPNIGTILLILATASCLF
jgi:hypothetical protein